MIQLRDYQNKLISDLRDSIKSGNKRLILCAPTGAGKTIMFSYLVSEHTKRGGRVLIFTHRTELLNQAGGTFEQFGIKAEYIKAGKEPDLQKNVHIAMVETFDRRMLKYSLFLKSRTMIIIDEAHLDTFTKLFPEIDKETIVIGATATPLRTGKQSCMSGFYQDLIQNVDTPDLIKLGFLSEAKTYGVNINMKGLKKKGDDYDTTQYYEENKIYEGVVQNWERICLNQKTILFASNVESSVKVCNEFLSKGYNAKHIDGTTPKKEREEILNWFDKTPDAVICNCGILNAGFDQKDIKCVILYRATTSLPLFLQMCGRGSRVCDGKKDFFILDFGNNIKRLDFWEEPRVWNIKKEEKKKKEGLAPKRECKNCNAILPAKTTECPYCGNKVEKSKEEAKNEIVELQLLSKKEKLQLANSVDLKEKARLAKNKVISPFWVLHNLTNYKDAVDFCGLMGYKNGFIELNKHRFKVFQNGR